MATTNILANDQLEISEDSLYEMIDGQKMEKPLKGVKEVLLANDLLRFIWQSLGEEHNVKEVMEMMLRLEPDGKLDRRPDVAFIPYSRWPDQKYPERMPAKFYLPWR